MSCIRSGSIWETKIGAVFQIVVVAITDDKRARYRWRSSGMESKLCEDDFLRCFEPSDSQGPVS